MFVGRSHSIFNRVLLALLSLILLTRVVVLRNVVLVRCAHVVGTRLGHHVAALNDLRLVIHCAGNGMAQLLKLFVRSVGVLAWVVLSVLSLLLVGSILVLLVLEGVLFLLSVEHLADFLAGSVVAQTAIRVVVALAIGLLLLFVL